MPLKRTPPHTPAPRAPSQPVEDVTLLASSETVCETDLEKSLLDKSSEARPSSHLIHYDSEPNLHRVVANITERKKRKFDGDDTCFMTSLKRTLDNLVQNVSCIKQQNAELTKSMELMSSKYDDFLFRIEALETKSREDKKYINLLEDKIESLERKARSSGIEIRNVPKVNTDKPESKDDLCNLVQSMGESINIDIKASDIRDIYRIPAKDSSKIIITEFTSVIMKENVLLAIKKFNKNKPKEQKLNTSHLKLKSSSNPIFVAETLSQKSQRLFYLARVFQKQHGYLFCWTSRGVIYLRKIDKGPLFAIHNEADLDKLKNTQ